MEFQRIVVEYTCFAVVVRFPPPSRGKCYDVPKVRDEMTQLASANPSQTLVVDFGDFQFYPAELLGCLAHAKQKLDSLEPIRCVNLPLRLQAASRLLRFEGTILEQYGSLKEAFFTALQLEESLLVMPTAQAPIWTSAA
jgi:hypothetical protein